MGTKRLPKEEFIGARVTRADKDFLKKHGVSGGEAISKYCELMRNKKEFLFAEKKLIENQLAIKKKEIFDIEMRLDDVKSQISELKQNENKSIEDHCIEAVAEVIMDKGFAKNNVDYDIFNNVHVLDMVSNYAYKCDMDCEVFKNKVVEFVLQ
ncbi:hypothetical protein [Methanobrevibacter wolinii]|uniref:hypothetical protein n=1 Tax=Methanobrevibacter wolinii TaxID=190977 RepID=UPI0005B2784A|nr:hypothetical protein [Methanobrevibacter wolinii]